MISTFGKYEGYSEPVYDGTERVLEIPDAHGWDAPGIRPDHPDPKRDPAQPAAAGAEATVGGEPPAFIELPIVPPG